MTTESANRASITSVRLALIRLFPTPEKAVFFFSSRRRHTRWNSDWSSDVCSSDLDVATAVAAPIEQQLSGLDGLLYFKSSNSSAGVMNLSVYFDVSRNPDLAAVDVQNQIALAEPQLPQEVVRNGITVQKRQTAILVVGALTADDPRFDAEYLSNYSKIYVQDELKRLPGV